MRLAWARQQQAAGRTVWPSPDILTWETWLARQWRGAVLRGEAPALQLLSASQERALWEQVLRDLQSDVPLAAHADGLMRAAGRATQGLLMLSRWAMSEEELLLAHALAEARARCAAHGLLALRLAPRETLQFLRAVPPPAIIGEPRLSPLQELVRQQCWNGAVLLLPPPAADASAPSLRRYPDADAELAACADWCLARLRADAGARLLVITACVEPSLQIQGELLWRWLAGAAGNAESREHLLAVEGGTPLHLLGLIGDALLALDCLQPELDTGQLYCLLRSPYFQFGTQRELWSLQGRFEKWALASWSSQGLRQALASVAGRETAAARLLAWLDLLHAPGRAQARHGTGEWARIFSEALAAAGFCGGVALDSRDQQRLGRWTELLDEFAALDAIVTPLGAVEATALLRQLAGEGRHQPATGDAAITLTGTLADPVAGYDGIWVLGLTESRWPAPPRPDAYVPLQQQRAHHWPESGVAERRAQAQWALSCWQRRTPELVLSYPETEGDVHHRPTALPGVPVAAWKAAAAARGTAVTGLAAAATDQQFPPLAAAALDAPLSGGQQRLRQQLECPFRAHAQWRLKAMPPEPLSDGLTAPLRGTLLHLLLQSVWEELQNQAALLALVPEAEHALLERHWHAVIGGGAIAGSRWWPAGLLERERSRTLEIMAEVLRLERARAPFTVRARELQLQWPQEGARVKLRIDRVDETADGTGVLVDYKSGAAGRMKLHEGALEPLQLALYVAALAAHGEPVRAAALFSLKPGEIAMAGVAAAAGTMLPGMRPIEDWESTTARWQRELLELLAAHLTGGATLARDHDACRHCHLSALCRRAALEDLEDADE